MDKFPEVELLPKEIFLGLWILIAKLFHRKVELIGILTVKRIIRLNCSNCVFFLTCKDNTLHF